MVREITLFTETVIDGQYANWPNEETYEEPVIIGHILKGWDFDWENTPITEDTDIYAIWEKVQMNISINHNNISFMGDSENTPTEISFWASTVNGNEKLPEGVTLTFEELLNGKQPIRYTEIGETTTDGKNVKTIKVLYNDDFSRRYLRVKAVTNKYGGMESDVIELMQEKHPDVYNLEIQSETNTMLLPIDAEPQIVYRTPSFVSTKNNEFYNDVVMELDSSCDWINNVDRVDGSDNELSFQFYVSSFPEDLDPSVGRHTTARIIQNGGNEMNLEIQQIMDVEGIRLFFVMKNDSGFDASLGVTASTTPSGETIEITTTTVLHSGESETISKIVGTEYEYETIDAHPLICTVNNVIDDPQNFTIESVELIDGISINIRFCPPE